MLKVYKNIAQILKVDALESTDGYITLTEPQLDALENSIESLSAEMETLRSSSQTQESTIADLNAQITALKSEKESLNTQIADLQKQLSQKPADSSSHVVEDAKTAQDVSPVTQFFETRSKARSLFNEVP